MIEKMQFLSITGPKDDIDRAIEQHLSKYEFQLESTMTELSETTGLKPVSYTHLTLPTIYSV